MLNKEEILIEIKDEQQLHSLTGITEAELRVLGQIMEELEEEHKNREFKEMTAKGLRVRKIGGGRKGILRTGIQKALFLLVFLKTYPTYNDLGNRFKMTRAAAFQNVKKYWPWLQEAFSRLGAMPGQQRFVDVHAFRDTVAKEGITINVAEWRQVDPQRGE